MFCQHTISRDPQRDILGLCPVKLHSKPVIRHFSKMKLILYVKWMTSLLILFFPVSLIQFLPNWCIWMEIRPSSLIYSIYGFEIILTRCFEDAVLIWFRYSGVVIA